MLTEEFLRPKEGPVRPPKGPLRLIKGPIRSIKILSASQFHIRLSQADTGTF